MPAIRNFIAIVFLATAFIGGAVAAPGKLFFKPFAGTKSARVPEGLSSEPVPIQWNAAEMLKLRPGEEVSLALPGLDARDVVFERADDHGGGIHSWVGYFKERGIDNRVMVTSGPNGSYGLIKSPDGIFRIIPGDRSQDWLVDMAKEPREVGPGKDDIAMAPTPAHDPAPRAMEEKATPTPQTTIDVMFVITQGLARRLGANTMTRLNFIVSRMNQVYADSEIAVTLRLVKVSVVDYTDGNSQDTALNAIAPAFGGGTGVFSGIEGERAAAGADLVIFYRDGLTLDGTGRGGIGFNSDGTFRADIMYTVVTGCVAGCEWIFLHETGHNMGLRHDRYTGASENEGRITIPTAHAYGYVFCAAGMTCTPDVATGTAGSCPYKPPSAQSGGPECADGTPVQDDTNFHDIMAYFAFTSERIDRFSNPNLQCRATEGDGILRPCGVPSTDPVRWADAAGSINAKRAEIASLKPTMVAAPMPGSLQFKSAAFSAAESGGSIVFTVSRVRDNVAGGGGGTASVTYTVTAATAASGDFTPGTGTLTWANGDFTDKTFSVPITADALAEGVETFNATLSNPVGNVGLSLGYPSTAVGMILETWPPAGTMPLGFVTPTSNGWTTATDQAFEGTTSLRSAQGAQSDLTFTANISAGQAAFAYRVSALLSSGSLVFSLDGEPLLTANGETGWQVFNFTIPTSGTHTLSWRYNPASFLCSSPCQNRAWIDAVSLPPLTSPISTVSFATSATSVTQGTAITLSAAVNGAAGPGTGTIEFTDNSLRLMTVPLNGAGQASLVVPSLKVGQHQIAAKYSGDANYAGSTTPSVSVTVAAPPATAPHLSNISTRMQVLTGNDVLIGGFVIGGSVPKTVAIVATGPSLTQYGITNALKDPELTLVRSSDQAVIATNSIWRSDPSVGLLEASGFAPSSLVEAALLVTLPPGAYTAIVSGAFSGSVPATGVGVIAVYEVDHPEVPLVNISTRGRVMTGNDVMIGGFVVQGSGPQTVVVTATGPSLAQYGIAQPLANPTLQLVRSSDQAVIATNDDWQGAANAAQIQAAGFAPAHPQESAIMMTLQPGAYTAIVSGVGGGTGVGIVAVYTVP